MIKQLHALRCDVRGAASIEYGLIAALIVIAAMGAIITTAQGTIGVWSSVANKVDQAQ